MTDLSTQAGTVHHVSFRITDLDTALEFYHGILGCR
jgi:catechol 2,3-dioxygenase-like lactoylglutathione lyase family enzyme